MPDDAGSGWLKCGIRISERTPREVRIVLVGRLRARRVEIDDAIFARVSGRWFARAGSEDTEYVAGLRAAGVAALDYALVGIERWGESLEPVPAAALAQARRAARAGVGLDTVLRRYVAGYAVLEGFVMQETEHDGKDWIPPTHGRALRDVLQGMSSLVDRLIAAVSSAYVREIEGIGRSPGPAEGVSAARLKWRGRGSGRSDRPTPAVSGGSAVLSGRMGGTRRERILLAMVEVAGERGFENTTVKLLTSRAGVSTSTFYEEFKGLRDCLIAVLDLALERVGGLIAQAFACEERWQDGVLGALTRLLVFFDSEPLLTRVWFVESVTAGSWALQRRERITAQLRSMIIEYWAVRGGEPPEPVAATGVMASVLGLIQAHLVNDEPGSLIELLGPSMGLVTTLYLDKQVVAQEVERAARLARDLRAGDAPGWALPPPPPEGIAGGGPDDEVPARLANPSGRRVRECLLCLAEHPDSSNSEVATAIGVAHRSQISKLLSYLLEEGLAVKCSGGVGAPNAWRLTARGEDTARALAERGD